jgi:hypothetical protein
MPDGLATSPYLNLPLRSLTEVSAERRRTLAQQSVRRAITLSRRAAERGYPDVARAAWILGERIALRCGGLSGSIRTLTGESCIVVEDGLVAWSPLPVVDGRGW